ncbi:MAG: hypothetical protein HRU40_21815, partial [Saprospiraceae bacterium]|nr:hypothetical protein [Saprospiraceae bacterium]
MTTLPGNPMTGGEWLNIDGVPADLSDSTQVEFAAFPTGTFRFDYVTEADMSCPADTARLTVEVTNLRDVSCLDTVNLSLDDSCYFFVEPSLFLTSPTIGGIDSLYEIVLVSSSGALVGDTITPEYVGQVLDAFIRIPGCADSYCMGAIRTLDLMPPVIDSVANPMGMDSLLCYDIDSILNVDASWNDPTYTYYIGGPVFRDNCSTPTVTVSDVISFGECDTSFATLRRTFIAEDAFGLTTDTTINYPFYVPSLVPAGKLPDVKVNTCTPAGTLVPPTYPYIINAFGDTLYITENECDHSSGFEDREFILCGGTRKIERIIKLFDWCTNESINVDTLNILIGDFEGPVIAQGADTISVSMAPFACEASFRLEQSVLESMFALSFSDCSDTVILNTSFVSYFSETDFWGTPTGDSSFMHVDYPVSRNIVSGIPLGVHGIVINATDGCGNSSLDTAYFRVKDFISPVVQCDDVINISLSSAGYAQLTAEDADEGTWDNCGLDRLQIRRFIPEACRFNYDRNNNGVVVGDELDASGYTRFDDASTMGTFVEFWCCDLETMPVVELWAWDIYGNYGFCELEILLEDKYLPAAAAPADTITICLDPSLDGDLANFGAAVVVGDDCGLAQIVELAPEMNIKQCGTGTITRRFQSVKYMDTDRELRSAIVEQNITV